MAFTKTDPPKRTSTRTAKPKALLTSAKRQELLDARLQSVIDWCENRAKISQELGDERAAQIDLGTAFIVNMNKADLVRVYSQAADQSVPFARTLDYLLTGGIWGELFALTISTLIAVGLIRGWIHPDQLPPPIRQFLPKSMFNVPASEEVQNEEEKAAETAPTNGNPSPRKAPATDEPTPPASGPPKKGETKRFKQK